MTGRGEAPAPRPVAMLAHTYYEEDPRVRREAESLAASGRPVTVYALRRPGDPVEEQLAGVDVQRIDVQRHQGAGLATYTAEYLAFMTRAGWRVWRDHRTRHWALLQVHSLPDFLAFAGLPLRLRGVPLVLDLHEAMPEFFRTRFPRASSRPSLALLNLQERASIRIADIALTVNEALADRLVRLGVPAAKVVVVRNSPSLARFDPAAHPARSFMADGVLRLVYAGALSPIYELDLVLEALDELRRRRPGLAVHLDLYGRDFSEVPLAEHAARLGLAAAVTTHGRIAIDAVPAALAAADVGLAPTRRSAFTDFSLSTKIFEYAAMGKPVVASRLPIAEQAFPPRALHFYEPGERDGLVAAIEGVVDDPAARAAGVAAALAVVAERSWEREAERYVEVIEGVIAARPR